MKYFDVTYAVRVRFRAPDAEAALALADAAENLILPEPEAIGGFNSVLDTDKQGCITSARLMSCTSPVRA